MPRSQRISPLVRIAETRERSAARSMVAARQHLQSLQDRLSQLQDYRDQYRRHLDSNRYTSIAAGRLQELQRFLAQLDAGIAELHVQLQAQRQLTQGSREFWRHAYRRSHALDKLLARMHEAERDFGLRAEANELDERRPATPAQK